jgi:hypothetical protein
MDDLFDVIGLSIFVSGGTWCLLHNRPCVPMPCCSECMLDGYCPYRSEEDQQTKEAQ